MSPREARFLQLLREKALLPAERIEEALGLREASGSEGSLPDLLVGLGLLSASARDALFQDVYRDGAPSSTTPTLAASPGSPPADLPQEDFPGYEVIEEIGHGGMGVVYKARQVELGRLVALKVVRAGSDADAEALERFQREARAAARLEHPNVVRVFEAGRARTCHFIAMQYVEGSPLSVLLRKAPLPVKSALELARKVALALHYAHEHGVIHRDVKPGNILVDAEGEPHVADFGLAKDITTERLTRSGTALGTPNYAPPEQLGGESGAVGPRSDVYGLGATLYEMLTGQPPFTGDSAFSVVTKVLMEDPEPPRRLAPSLDIDAETICLKALEKSPERRYASARDMAEDLRRCLEGEPLSARPVTPLSRLWRRAVRHRWIVLPSAAAVLVASAAVAWKVQASRLSKKNAETETRRLTAEADAARARGAWDKAQLVDETMARFAALSEGTLWPMEATLYEVRLPMEERRRRNAEHWKEVERFMAETPDDPASQAAMRSAAGWARRLAGYEAEGLEWMREAEKLDPDVPYGALLLALIQFSKYVDSQPLPPFTVGWGTGVSFSAAPPEQPGAQGVREEMERDLARAEKAIVWGKQEAHAYRAALDGMRAVHRGAYDDAERALTQALSSPGLSPVRGGLLIARGKVRYIRKDFDGALADLVEAKRTRAGQPEVWDDLGLVRQGRAEVARLAGKDPRETFRAAIADFDEGLRIDGSDLSLLLDRASAWEGLADAQADHGEDPRESYGRAIDDGQRAIEVEPKSVCAASNLGHVRWSLAEAQAARGLDPRETLRKAAADCDRAIRLDADYGAAYVNRGNVHSSLAAAGAARGEDPRPEYERALADFGAALKRDAGSVEAYCNRGSAFQSLADEERRRGLDPTETLRKAIADLDQAVQKRPQWADAYNNRGNAYCTLGETQDERREDGVESLRKGIADFDASLRCNPDHTAAFLNRGNAWRTLGLLQEEKGEDPCESYRKGIADAEEAMKRDAESPNPHGLRGALWWSLGAAERRKGADPRASFRKAIEDYGEALKRNPEHTLVHYNRGIARLGLAAAEQAAGGVPEELLHGAREDFDAALERNPRFWSALDAKGQVLEALGEAERAVECYERAIAIAGDAAGEVRQRLARAKARAKGGAWARTAQQAGEAIQRGDYPAARKLYEEALAAAGAETLRDEAARQVLGLCHYNLACILSLLSAGRDSPSAQARTVAAGEASRLRDEAFAHLSKAAELGQGTREDWSKDGDLVPLHDSPKWEELLKRLGR